MANKAPIVSKTAAALSAAIAGCAPLCVLLTRGGDVPPSVVAVAGGVAACGIVGAWASVRFGHAPAPNSPRSAGARRAPPPHGSHDGTERTSVGPNESQRPPRTGQDDAPPSDWMQRPPPPPPSHSIDDALCDRVMAWFRTWSSTLPERRTEAQLAEGDLLGRKADDIVRRRLVAREGADGLAAAAALDRLKGWNEPGGKKLVAVLLRRIVWSGTDLQDNVAFRLYETRRGARTWDFEGEGRGRRRAVQDTFAPELWLWSRGGPLPQLEETVSIEGGARGERGGPDESAAGSRSRHGAADGGHRDGGEDPRAAGRPPHGLAGQLRLHMAVLGMVDLPDGGRDIDAAVEACQQKPERRIEADVESFAIARAALALRRWITDKTTCRPDPQADAAVDRMERRDLMRLEVLGLFSPPNRHGLKTAWRQRQLESHPDHGGTHDESVAVNQAYDALSKSLKDEDGH